MNSEALKNARLIRGMAGWKVAAILGLTVDGYFKKEHGQARTSLQQVATLTSGLGLTLEEFTDIFFDGELPFCQEKLRSYNYGKCWYPLKEARAAAMLTEGDVAEKLGISEEEYRSRELGKTELTLEECSTLSKLFNLTFKEFNTIFFRSCLPYRNEDVLNYKNSIAGKDEEINVEASNSSGI